MPDITVMGDDLLSITLHDAEQRHAIAQHLRSQSQWLECVPGMQSVVVQFDSARVSVEEAAAALRNQLSGSIQVHSAATQEIEIPVCYGGEFGPDLEAICAMLGMSVDEFIELHTSAQCHVDMLGFTPGFAYIGGLSKELAVPRLTEPRSSVPGGSVGVMNNQSGVYAMGGPGGWPLVGRTPIRLFDYSADDPFVVRAGCAVTFVAIDDMTYRRMIES
ncbi:MAG: 5-oxoprolinase subunit PxpB [Pseudomonadota bacterium]